MRAYGSSALLLVAAAAALIGEPQRTAYDGRSDDLLTAGLGAAGLRGAAPGFADPLQPTWAEQRRRAIYQNYRGLIDVSAEGGYGTAYGASGDAGIAGIEYVATMSRPGGGPPAALLLQIPAGFDAARPCLVVVASSGSRGLYGALPTAGEWGLRRGCAVAHTDKGTGMGLYDVDQRLGLDTQGRVVPAAAAAFAPSDAELAGLPPHSLAFRHAHSRTNPEADWGRYVLQAGQLALQLLDREYAGRGLPRFTAARTQIIAAGISNGGGAVLRALELDRRGFFDGAVVAEPNVAVAGEYGLRVGAESPRRIAALGLYDSVTLHALLQPCAILAEPLALVPLGGLIALAQARHAAWCRSLADAGLAAGDDAGAQAQSARAQLIAAGIEPEALQLGALNLQFGLWTSVATTYAAAYARASVAGHPCGLGFAALDAQGAPRALTDIELARAFSDYNGIPPGGAIGLVRRTAEGRWAAADAQGFATVRCLRDLRETLQPALAALALRGDAGRRPVIVLHGRDDSLVAVNHSSRGYVAASWGRRGADGRDALRYYELPGVQHFDAFVPLPGMRGPYRPMQPHLNAALDLLQARLAQGRPLPPSQVVREAIRAEPGADAIGWRDGILSIPR